MPYSPNATLVPPEAMPLRLGWCCLRCLTLRGTSMTQLSVSDGPAGSPSVSAAISGSGAVIADGAPAATAAGAAATVVIGDSCTSGCTAAASGATTSATGPCGALTSCFVAAAGASTTVAARPASVLIPVVPCEPE